MPNLANDIELPRDPPADASPFGLAMHYGNALVLEMLRRRATPAGVTQGLLWYAAVFCASQPISADELIEQFRTTLERLRAGSRDQ